MKQITFLIILLACFLTINGIYIRTKRQIEREDEETVVADKKVRESLGDEEDDEKDTEVMEVDVNEKDGSFNFGGHFPSIFNHGHTMPSSFQEFFNQMQQRFEGKLYKKLCNLQETNLYVLKLYWNTYLNYLIN